MDNQRRRTRSGETTDPSLKARHSPLPSFMRGSLTRMRTKCGCEGPTSSAAADEACGRPRVRARAADVR
jgi:hypothetical protein